MDSNEPLAQPGLDLELLNELQQLEEHLRGAGAYLADLLRPGLTAGEITALTGGTFDPVPAELLTWYAWHDGANHASGDDDGESYLPNRMYVFSLDEAMTRRDDLLETDGPQQNELPSMTFQPTWLPLVGGSKFSLVADLTAGASHPVPILDVGVEYGGDWTEVQEPSITSMVRAWNTHFANGNYRWNREKRWWDDHHPFYDADHSAVT